jgi:mRNA interferase MazF
MAGVADLPAPRRGEVWFADVPGDKRRPVLVLSRDPLGGILHSVICAPITSTIRGLATEVALGTEAGLVRPSVANFDNAFLLGRRRLVRRLGRASRTTMDAACEAMGTAIGCPMRSPRS